MTENTLLNFLITMTEKYNLFYKTLYNQLQCHKKLGMSQVLATCNPPGKFWCFISINLLSLQHCFVAGITSAVNMGKPVYSTTRTQKLWRNLWFSC